MPIINATVLYDFEGKGKSELRLRKGEYLLDVEDKGEGWWLGEKMTAKDTIIQGFFPGSYVDFDLEEFTARVTHAFEGNEASQITLRVGDIVKVDDVSDGGWYYGETADGREGWFPLSFTTEMHIGSLSASKDGTMKGKAAASDDAKDPNKDKAGDSKPVKMKHKDTPKKGKNPKEAKKGKKPKETFAALKKQPDNPEAQGSLLLKIFRGENLPARDVTGKSDPYVCIYKRVNEKKNKKYTFKTKWKEQTLDPVWMEQFQVNIKRPEDMQIELEVWDKDNWKPDDYMGTVKIPMRAGARNYDKTPKRKWFDLETEGRIEVELRFIDTSNVGAPTDFKHIGHMGFNADGGFDVDNMQFDTKWKKVFQTAGISPADLKDPETARLVAGVIQGAGGAPEEEPLSHAPPAPVEPTMPTEACPLRRSRKRVAATENTPEPKDHAPPPPDDAREPKKLPEADKQPAHDATPVAPAAPAAPTAPVAPPPTLSSAGLTTVKLKKVEKSDASVATGGGLLDQIKGGRGHLQHVDLDNGIDLQPLNDEQANSMGAMLKAAMEARRKWIVVEKAETVAEDEDVWDEYGGDDDEWL